MVIIEEEKLEEMVRRAVKAEMTAILGKQGNVMGCTFSPVVMEKLQTILTRLGLVLDITVSEAVKKEIEPILTKREPEPLAETKYLYSIKELAEYLHCCVRTAQNMKNSGLLPYKQIGRKVIFNSSEILKAMEPKKLKFHRK